MKVLVTGSAGHLGEALVRTLAAAGYEVVGLDIRESPFTTAVGSVTEHAFLQRNIAGAQVIFHAATLHKPHVATHARSEFVEVNIGGTLNLLEEARGRSRRSRPWRRARNRGRGSCDRTECRDDDPRAYQPAAGARSRIPACGHLLFVGAGRYLVTLGRFGLSLSGSLGENDTVSQAFQPAGRCVVSNSQ